MRLFGRKEKENRPWQADMERQLQAAKEQEFEPPALSDIQRAVVLLRQWFRVYKAPMAATREEILVKLSRIEEIMMPAGLSEPERRKWYWGGLQEASRRYIVILNTSYSKAEMAQRLAKEGLELALEGFDESTQRQLVDGVIKYLPEGKVTSGAL